MTAIRHEDAPASCTIECHLDEPHQRALAEDVLDGLTRPFKELPPKHLYDDRGAALFERICSLPEYYQTRTERSILADHAATIAETTDAVDVVELGSGSAAKARLVLDALYERGSLRRYVPVDVTESLMRATAAELMDEYPGLALHGVVGDFERHLDRVPPTLGRRLVMCLGGTLGNLLPGSRRRLLRTAAGLLGDDGHLLYGVDLVKDAATLRAAYADSAGVTAEFNRNMLHVLNRELAADFNVDNYEHVALYDLRHEWIEMRLRAREPEVVTIHELGLRVRFAAGEELRTEVSAKFTRSRVEADLDAAGLRLCAWLSDDAGRYAVAIAAPALEPAA